MAKDSWFARILRAARRSPENAVKRSSPLVDGPGIDELRRLAKLSRWDSASAEMSTRRVPSTIDWQSPLDSDDEQLNEWWNRTQMEAP